MSNITYPVSSVFEQTPALASPLTIAPSNVQVFSVTFAPTRHQRQRTSCHSRECHERPDQRAHHRFWRQPGTNNSWRLTIITNPPSFGTVTPNDAKVIKTNKVITLTANPKNANYKFVNWTGSYNTASNPLVFKMTNDTIVEANFITNPFLALAGIYNGLFSAANAPLSQSNAGMLKALAVTSEGAYSGSLLLNGATKSITGNFSPDLLQSSDPVTFRGTESTVELSMNLISNNPAPIITGTVSNTTQNWVSTNLVAVRAADDTQASSAYTLTLEPDTNVASTPGGYGYALIAVTAGSSKKATMATITGRLADGTAFSQSVGLSGDGFAPLYSSLYSGKGMVLGWINFTNTAGPLYWIHPGISTRRPNSLQRL